VDRYSRQQRVAGIGDAGQQRLRGATVLIVGCGALGTHSADALARAGIGRLLLVDRDIVEWSNLQRQVLFTEADAEAGAPKAIAAAARLAAVNRECAVEAHVADCSAAFLAALRERPDLVLDGTDNFPTRYVINDWCRQQRVPWIYAGATGTEGASMVITEDGPCLRCLWPEPPTASDVGTCETVGILAPAVAAVTAFQVAEAIKLLVAPDSVTNGVFSCDVWRGVYTTLALAARQSPDCVACARGEYPALLAPPPLAATLCGRDAVQIDPGVSGTLDLRALEQRLAGAASELVRTPHLLRFAADGCRFSVFPGGRALLFGVRDPLRARSLYDRWVGA
jgi:adenylyltransferase/sulfurtransferase